MYFSSKIARKIPEVSSVSERSNLLNNEDRRVFSLLILIKGHCYFAAVGQFCAKIITLRL